MWPSYSPSFSQNLSTTYSAFLEALLALDSRRRGLGYSTSSDSDPLAASTSFLTGLGAGLALSLFMVGFGSSSSTSSTSSASSLCFLSLLASLLETLSCSALGPGVRLSYLRLNSLTSLSTCARCCMGSQVQSFRSGQPAHRIRYIIPLPVSFLSMISSTSQYSQLRSTFDFIIVLKLASQIQYQG